MEADEIASRADPCAAYYSPLQPPQHSRHQLRLRQSRQRSSLLIASTSTSGNWTTGVRTPIPSPLPSWVPAVLATLCGPQYFLLERSRTRPTIVDSLLFACSIPAHIARSGEPGVAMALRAAASNLVPGTSLDSHRRRPIRSRNKADSSPLASQRITVAHRGRQGRSPDAAAAVRELLGEHLPRFAGTG
jgi:hypothetical protein